jgi:hypothetical protein
VLAQVLAPVEPLLASMVEPTDVSCVTSDGNRSANPPSQLLLEHSTFIPADQLVAMNCFCEDFPCDPAVL